MHEIHTHKKGIFMSGSGELSSFDRLDESAQENSRSNEISCPSETGLFSPFLNKNVDARGKGRRVEKETS